MTEHATTQNVLPDPPAKKRLVSLDALRGFDLFLLFGLCPIFQASLELLNRFFPNKERWDSLADFVCRHSEWEGFTLYDLIMPLFMFMSGVTICYSMAKYKKSESNPNPSRGRFWCRLVRRVLLLWIFGMIAQGNLLDFRWEGMRLYSNTLQAIAAGYVIAVACYFLFNKWGTLAAAFLLMLAYWLAMTFSGKGFEPGTNLAEVIDRTVLGRWMDGVSFQSDGTWSFSEEYHYTWILSTLTFGATAISGLLGGQFIRWRTETGKSGHLTALFLVAIGVLCAVTGWFWGKVPQGVFGYCPLIKHLWTPSMVLYASGISYILLGIFHEVYDVLRFPLFKTFLLVIGMNSIVTYMLPYFVDFQAIAGKFLGGLEHHIGVWYAPLLALTGFGLTWWFLWLLYKNKTFLRL